MAKYYGTVKGGRETSATRTGTANSGIRASVQSYNGSVISYMYGDKEPIIQIEIADGSNTFGHLYFDGTIDDLKRQLTK